MLKRSTSRTLIATSLVAVLAGCASNNPYDNQPNSSNKTAIYGGLEPAHHAWGRRWRALRYSRGLWP